jgi:hypothetical protein
MFRYIVGIYLVNLPFGPPKTFIAHAPHPFHQLLAFRSFLFGHAEDSSSFWTI